MSLGGLIGAALKGGGEGYAAAAKGEMEQQQKIDYQQKYLQMLEEKEARADERRQEIELAGIPRKAIATATGAAAARGINLATDAQYMDKEAEVAARKKVTGIEAARAAGVPTAEAGYNADVEGAGYDAALNADLPSKKAKVKRADLEANKPNVVEEASQVGTAEGTKQTSKTRVPGYTASVSAEAGAKESSSVKARNSREQQDWDNTAKARKAYADWVDATDRGDVEAAKKARREVVMFGGNDPEGTRRGALKVTEDDNGDKVLVHEDAKGNVTRVDTNTLEPYPSKPLKVGGGGVPAPKNPDELAKLAPGTTYRAPDGSLRTKSQ